MIGALLERHPRFANWLYGFTPPERGTVVLVHRRVYIVPTRLGWLFAATLGILLIGSINYALALGFALTFFLAGMGFAAMVHTARNLARMGVSTGRAEPVFAGESAQFRLHLDGRARFDRPAILARHLACGAQFVVDIPAHAMAEVVLDVPAKRRGPGRRHKLRPGFRVGQKLPDAAGQGGRIARRHEPPGHALRDEVADATHIGGEDRDACRHGLDEGYRRPLVLGATDYHVQLAQNSLQIIPPSQEVDTGRETKILG